MTKEFLFGKVYENPTPELKEKLYKSKTTFEINKNTFINSSIVIF